MGKRKNMMQKRMEMVKAYEEIIIDELISANQRQPHFGIDAVLSAWKYRIGKLNKESSRKGLVSLASLNVGRTLQLTLEKML